MANLSKLSAVRAMVKAEMGWQTNPLVATAQDTEINSLIETRQQWLASENDWPFLKLNVDVGVAAGQQYIPYPANINFQRATSLMVSVFYNQTYLELVCGIGLDQYNTVNNAIGQFQDPIERYDFAASLANSAEQYIEVWPVGQNGQTVRFTGQTFVATLRNNDGTFNDNALLSLDDLLVTYNVCSKLMLRREDKSAQEMLSAFNKRMVDLRASYPKKGDKLFVKGDKRVGTKLVRLLPIITVAPRGNN